jgi:hypothetical protein
MSVSKYRSIADMPPPARASSETLVARIRTLWNRSFVLSPPHFARGVTRFRNIDEANAAREAETHARMRARRGPVLP